MITKKWANTAANLMAFVRLVCPPSGYLHRRARIDIIGLPSEMLSEKYTYDVAEGDRRCMASVHDFTYGYIITEVNIVPNL